MEVFVILNRSVYARDDIDEIKVVNSVEAVKSYIRTTVMEEDSGNEEGDERSFDEILKEEPALVRFMTEWSGPTKRDDGYQLDVHPREFFIARKDILGMVNGELEKVDDRTLPPPPPERARWEDLDPKKKSEMLRQISANAAQEGPDYLRDVIDDLRSTSHALDQSIRDIVNGTDAADMVSDFSSMIDDLCNAIDE